MSRTSVHHPARHTAAATRGRPQDSWFVSIQIELAAGYYKDIKNFIQCWKHGCHNERERYSGMLLLPLGTRHLTAFERDDAQLLLIHQWLDSPQIIQKIFESFIGSMASTWSLSRGNVL